MVLILGISFGRKVCVLIGLWISLVKFLIMMMVW